MQDKSLIIKDIAEHLLSNQIDEAAMTIQEKYPFEMIKIFHRNYSINQKMNVFTRDGFIDRYTGNRLVNPGILKVISAYYPTLFPYHKNGKMTEGHISYWELFPTIDHVEPIAAGGIDAEENWVTTSMINNSVKSNWTLQQLRWELYETGDVTIWDGLTSLFINIVEMNSNLQNDRYIMNWYKASMKIKNR